MLNTFIEGLEEGVNDEQRTAFRTMFISKRDARTAVVLAKIYQLAKQRGFDDEEVVALEKELPRD